MEIGFDLVKLALYDIVFLLDDSGSIKFSRLQNELKSILSSAAFASSLFDQDGFSVRFMNSNLQADGVRSEQQAEELVNRADFSGVTPLAASLNKVLVEFAPRQSNMPPALRKPVLIIIITDGVVSCAFVVV